MLEMEYHKLLEKEKLMKKEFKLKIAAAKKKMHTVFFSNNRWKFIMMDLFVVCVLLFNFGAVLITNMMVYRDNDAGDVIIKEANPIQAKLNNYEAAPQGAMLLKSLMIQSMIWAVLVLSYVKIRSDTVTDGSMYILMFTVFFMFISAAFDFFNDFGFLLGQKVYGG